MQPGSDLQDNCPKLPWMIDFHTSNNLHIPNAQFRAAFADSALQYLSNLSPKSQTPSFRTTQIISTIPPYVTCKTFEELLVAGISVARIQIRKFDKEKVYEVVSKIRSLTGVYSKKIGKIYNIALAVDIQGPQIKTGFLKDPTKKNILLEKGQPCHLTNNPGFKNHVSPDMIYVNYHKFNEIVHVGDKVLLGNNSVTLSTVEICESIVKCVVEKAGKISDLSPVIIPGAPIELPFVSAEDEEILKFVIEANIDAIFISAVIDKYNVINVRQALGVEGAHVMLISKIENSLAVDHIDEIIEVSDGLCLDGEKLMMELPREKVFLVQKSVLAKCNLSGRPCTCTVEIGGTNGLNKAEVCDIANCIIEGVDSLLFLEDSSSNNVMKQVNMVCKEAEPAVHHARYFYELQKGLDPPVEPAYSIAVAAVEASLKTSAAAIVVCTSTGRGAMLLSRFKPRSPIIAITRHGRVARALRFYKGVDPLLYTKPFKGNWEVDVEDRTRMGITYGKVMGYIRMGDIVVTLSGTRPGAATANVIKLVYASDFDIDRK